MKAETKHKILKIAIAVVILAIISVGFGLVFHFYGYHEFQRLVEKSGAIGWLVFIVLEVLITVLLCFVPGTSMAIILIGVAIFGAKWQTFLICFSGVILSSVAMDLVGRFGGSRIVIWLVGKSDYERAVDLVQRKGSVYIPLFYLFPAFPDDAICMVAGMSKVNFWFHLGSIILCRGLGCATIVFGVSILPIHENMTIWEWVEIITIIAFWVIVAFTFATWVGRKIEKRIVKKKVERTSQHFQEMEEVVSENLEEQGQEDKKE